MMGDRQANQLMIKICGITRRDDALAAAEAGATAIGFVFAPESPRWIAPERAAEIGEGIPVLKVGVFVDKSPRAIKRIIAKANLDIAQIYCDTAPPAPRLGGIRVWKAKRFVLGTPVPDASDCEALLLDGRANGVTFDWHIARGAAHRVIVAGGLDASNVTEAIRIAEPWGVDASSRLESMPGIKDHAKLRAFIHAAREAAERIAL